MDNENEAMYNSISEQEVKRNASTIVVYGLWMNLK